MRLLLLLQPPSVGHGMLVAVLCLCTCARLVWSLDTDPKPLWTSRVNITHDHGLQLYEQVGHIGLHRWAWLAPMSAFSDKFLVGETRIMHDTAGIIWYVVLQNETEEVWSSFDPPDIFTESDDMVVVKELHIEPGPAPTVVDALGANALRFRVGTHFYSQCFHGGPHFWWPTNLHLATALEPFLQERARQRLYVINIGAAHLSPRDPLSSLFRGKWLVDGVSFDIDKEGLQASRRTASKHPMRWIKADISPGNIMGILHRYNASRRVVDILKVDIDSCDLAVLEAILANMWPAVIVAEWLLQIPPPWEFTFLRSRASGSDGGAAHFMGGTSLSALVKALLLKGYFLFKVSYVDAIFVHYSVAEVFVQAEKSRGVELRFPVDEWACYLTTPMYAYIHGNMKEIRPLGGWQGEYTREWMVLPLEVAEARIRGNLSHVYGDDWDYLLRASEPNAAVGESSAAGGF